MQTEWLHSPFQWLFTAPGMKSNTLDIDFQALFVPTHLSSFVSLPHNPHAWKCQELLLYLRECPHVGILSLPSFFGCTDYHRAIIYIFKDVETFVIGCKDTKNWLERWCRAVSQEESFCLRPGLSLLHCRLKVWSSHALLELYVHFPLCYTL